MGLKSKVVHQKQRRNKEDYEVLQGSSSEENYDEEEESKNDSFNTKGNNTSLIVNVNDTLDSEENMDGNSSSYSMSDNENPKSNDEESSSRKSSSVASSRKNNKSHQDDQNKRKSNSLKDSSSSTKNRRKESSEQLTRYLWVSGVPAGTKTEVLEEFFSQHGTVLAIKIIRGGEDDTLLGFVKLESADQAQKCMEKLNNTDFRGNKIQILKERPKDSGGLTHEKRHSEKIGFRSSPRVPTHRPPISRRPSAPSQLSNFRSPYQGGRRGGFHSRPPLRMSSTPHHRISQDMRRQENDEFFQLQREKQKLKIERMRFERDKEELLKLERETRFNIDQHPSSHQRSPQNDHHQKPRNSIRSMISKPRGPMNDDFLTNKRNFDSFTNKRDNFNDGRRGFVDSRASPSIDQRKISSKSFGSSMSSSRFGGDVSTRAPMRFDSKYDSKWQTISSEDSWMSNSGNGGDRGGVWSSSSTSSFDHQARIPNRGMGHHHSIGSRIHSSPNISHHNISSTRNYFNNNRRY